MASRLELMQLLQLGKKMDRDIAYKIYGYAVTCPEFEEEALSLMEQMYILYAAPEDRNPRKLYGEIMGNHHRERDEELKSVAHWFAGECEKQWEKRREVGEQARTRQQRKQWQQKSRERWAEMSEALGFQPIIKEK